MRKLPRLLLPGLIVIVGTAFGTSLAAAGIAFDMPSGWVPSVPSSTMRVAEFALPRAAGDTEDASVVIYFFPGGGGTVQANLDRWIGQMTQPNGSSSAEAAKTSSLQSTAGLKMTVVDLAGTYVAEVTPGSSDRFNKPGFRLRAAVVETPDGPYYVKVVGPQATISKWDASLQSFLKSMRPGPRR
jgi:hypothetical protein